MPRIALSQIIGSYYSLGECANKFVEFYDNFGERLAIASLANLALAQHLKKCWDRNLGETHQPAAHKALEAWRRPFSG